MSENIKNWLIDLYETEIKETRGNISNIKLWLCGSLTEEEWFEHTQYLEELEEYVTVLTDRKNKLEEN